uniref:(northern house mosquito) hypothetical protein n=1 Tax=Culex pipiens TaxID=7175 RepID=A0A8D8CT53_CULPI
MVTLRGFLLLLFVECSVCILKIPFSLHNFRQYTNMSARVCLCLRMLLASLFTLPLLRLLLLLRLSMRKKTHLFRVTLLLFLAAFSTANRKIQKGKVQPFLFKFNV